MKKLIFNPIFITLMFFLTSTIGLILSIYYQLVTDIVIFSFISLSLLTMLLQRRSNTEL